MALVKNIIQVMFFSSLLAVTWLSVHAEDNEDAHNVGNNFGKGKTFFL